MKHPLLFLVLVLTPGWASAQLFSGDAGRGTILGGLVGGVIGHNSNRRTMEGIGIGAGTGWLLGTLNREHRQRGSYDTYIPSRRRSVYADSAPVSRRPNYAVTGTAVGAVAGGIIGHNQGRKTLEGMGIGAAAGLVTGGIAEQVARRRETRHYYAHEAPPVLNTRSRFYRNPVPPAVNQSVRQRQTQSETDYVFEKIDSSQTSRRRPRPMKIPGPPRVQPAQSIVIHNHYYHAPPVATNSPATKSKSAGR